MSSEKRNLENSPKKFKPIKTSSRKSLNPLKPCLPKRMQRSSTRKNLHKIKKNLLTSTMIEKKSLKLNLSRIDKSGDFSNDSTMPHSTIFQTPVILFPNKRIVDIIRLTDLSFSNQSCALSNVSFQRYGEFNIWIV